MVSPQTTLATMGLYSDESSLSLSSSSQADQERLRAFRRGLQAQVDKCHGQSSSSSNNDPRSSFFPPPPSVERPTITTSTTAANPHQPGRLQRFLSHRANKDAHRGSDDRRSRLTSGDATSFRGSAIIERTLSNNSSSSLHSSISRSHRKSGRRSLLQAVQASARQLFKHKTVKFANGNSKAVPVLTHVRLVQLVGEYTDKERDCLWWSAAELTLHKRDAEDLAALWEARPALVPTEQQRGLEDKTPEGQWVAYRARRDVWRAVLDVQDQRGSTPAALLAASVEITQDSVATAIQRGTLDAQEAHNYCVEARLSWEAHCEAQRQASAIEVKEAPLPTTKSNDADVPLSPRSAKKKKKKKDSKKSSSDKKKRSGSFFVGKTKKSSTKTSRSASLVVTSKTDLLKTKEDKKKKKKKRRSASVLLLSRPGDERPTTGVAVETKSKKKHKDKESKTKDTTKSKKLYTVKDEEASPQKSRGRRRLSERLRRSSAEQ